MSILDQVRKSFQTPMSGTCKTSKSHSAGSAGTEDRHLKSCSTPSAGSAGPVSKLEGRRVLCVDCRHFDPKENETPDGWCSRYATQTWGREPFTCPGYSAQDPEREARRDDVLRRLVADPSVSRVCVAIPQGDGSYLVTLALRGIGTCELVIAGDRLSSPKDWADFLEHTGYGK